MYYLDIVISWLCLGEYVYDVGFDFDLNMLDVLIGWICCKFGVELIYIYCG